MGYLIRVENFRTGGIRYAESNRSGTPNREDAAIFESREQADHVALEILHIVKHDGFVEVLEEK